jgi:tripartite-type tricarboxylate transporter receptor subunit TctC
MSAISTHVLRRLVLAYLALLAGCLAAATAQAQEWPQRPVRVIVTSWRG